MYLYRDARLVMLMVKSLSQSDNFGFTNNFSFNFDLVSVPVILVSSAVNENLLIFG